MTRTPVLIHCSYHKCLTSYYRRVMQGLYHNVLRRRLGTYRHFYSGLEAFYAEHRGYRVASVNNHAPALDRLADFRLTRFIRDPRDLIISGYHYHRRGLEPWCHVPDPTASDWAVVAGVPPSRMGPRETFTSYLQRVDMDDGLIAEMEFRTEHFASMRRWPANDRRIRLFRYEDVLGHEAKVIGEIFSHYGVSSPERVIGRVIARVRAVDRQAPGPHIRDPSVGQWRTAFTPRVRAEFERRFGDLPEMLGYS